MNKENLWKRLSSKTVYENKWIRVREDQVIRPDGKPGIYGVVETINPAIFIIAQEENKKIFLVGQCRYTTGKFGWELPAGGSEGDDLQRAAEREIEEELGQTAKSWQYVGALESMKGISPEVMHVFIARDLEPSPNNKRAEEGITEVRAVTVEEFRAMIENGEMTDGQSIAAFTLARRHLS